MPGALGLFDLSFPSAEPLGFLIASRKAGLLKRPGRCIRKPTVSTVGKASNMSAESPGDDICRITQILNGRRAITGDTALRLAHFFGTSPEFWLNLQSLYEIRLAQQKSGKSIKALPTLRRAELA